MLIGLHGGMESGKDSVYQRVCLIAEVAAHIPAPRRIAFGDPMKRSAAAAIGASVEWIEENKDNPDPMVYAIGGNDAGITVREYIQRYGTEAHRDVFGQSFWIDFSLPMTLSHEGDLVIVTDVRFDNEAERVRDLGGEVWTILGPEDDKPERGHVSESGIDPRHISNVIYNINRKDDFASLDATLARLLIPAAEIRHG